eukprot:COSAG06_NODE_1409_length_9548_cov_10.589692_12_plen_247_part_00
MVIGVAWTNEQQSTVRLGTRIYICTEERTAGRIAQPTSSFAWPWVLRLVDRARLPLQDNGRAQRAVARRKGCSIVSSRTNVYKFPSGVRGAAKRAPVRAGASRGYTGIFLWADTNYTIIYMNVYHSAGRLRSLPAPWSAIYRAAALDAISNSASRSVPGAANGGPGSAPAPMAAVAADAAPAGNSYDEDKPIIRDFDGSDADFEKVHARADHRPPALSQKLNRSAALYVLRSTRSLTRWTSSCAQS